MNSQFKIISSGDVSGTYQAFPDMCRLDNGDIIAVFYAGYHHISFPNAEYPTGGKICMVRSSDEGRTWTAPVVIYDDERDNRDPHIAQLSDGSLICSFFSLFPCAVDAIGYPTEPVSGTGLQFTRSYDGGITWEKNVAPVFADNRWYVSAPVRELADGTCAQGLYYFSEGEKKAWGGSTVSKDKGRTWSAPVDIGRESGLSLPGETDIIQLKDGALLAALRGDDNEKVHLHFSNSSDGGASWSPVEDAGFFGHCPHMLRLSSGEILLTYRVVTFPDDVKKYYVGLRISRDDGQTWQGPYVIDGLTGAYASTVELKDKTILVIYYEEGEISGIRARRFRMPEAGDPDELEFLEFD